MEGEIKLKDQKINKVSFENEISAKTLILCGCLLWERELLV